MNPIVGIVMGSKSDLKVMNRAAETLEALGVPYELKVVSAHRTPLKMVEYASSARSRGLKVIIAGAGGAAHLPGMIASLTTLPVVGVPVNVTSLAGADALYSIVQMPAGIPVATVAIDNATNAALLAARMLGITDESLAAKLEAYAKDLEQRVEEMNREIQRRDPVTP